jgi:hypothetical protein
MDMGRGVAGSGRVQVMTSGKHTVQDRESKQLHRCVTGGECGHLCDDIDSTMNGGSALLAIERVG